MSRGKHRRWASVGAVAYGSLRCCYCRRWVEIPRRVQGTVCKHCGGPLSVTVGKALGEQPGQERAPTAPSSGAKTKRTREERERAREEAAHWEQDVREAAEFRGMNLRASFSESGKVQTPHWQFWADGRRVLDYWPATGRWWSALTGEKGMAADPWAALEMAAKLAGSCLAEGG